MAVLDPIKLVITNYPENEGETLTGDTATDGTSRALPFSGELWIEREDFMEVPAKKWFRLAPGMMVRLKNAYIVTCDSFEKDENGNITQIHCSYIPESKSGNDTSGLHTKGTIHWVSVKHASTAEVRLYDRLFKVEDPSSEEGDFKEYINPGSLHIIKKAYIEPSLINACMNIPYQFLRKGYFCLDKDSAPGNPVFNRTVTLKDAWAKEVKKV
jgi:glutaminyl-tRNA synthetase